MNVTATDDDRDWPGAPDAYTVRRLLRSQAQRMEFVRPQDTRGGSNSCMLVRV